MQSNAVAEKAMEEIQQPQFAATEQFLQVHELVFKDGRPEIIQVAPINSDNYAKVYFAVKDEKFFGVVQVDTKPQIAVKWVHTEDYCSIYLAAYSTILNVEELSALTILKPLRSWNKGDVLKPYKRPRENSAVFIEPNPGPGLFEDKLEKLLDVLEQDVQGVAKLIENCNTGINAALICHNANTMLGGPSISKSAIKRMAALNLEIGFDIYAEGKFFID